MQTRPLGRTGIQVSAYNDLQLATGAYYFAALAGLTVLAGLSGQISLGHGALMAIGAYTVALLIGNEGEESDHRFRTFLSAPTRRLPGIAC